MLDKIFSVKNESKHKVVRILGLKFKFKRKNNKQTITFKKFTDLGEIIRKNVSKLPADIDLIVGIPRSGIIPAYMLALFMNKRVCSLQEFTLGLIPQNGERNISNTEIKNVLIVDDSVNTGNALIKAKEELSKIDISKYNIQYLAIFATEDSQDKVDYFFEITKLPRLFQWNYLNSYIAKKCCYDMDGVLCVDPTNEENDDGERYKEFCLNAKPLFIPRYKIHSIVTSRIEKWRKETEIWLEKHGIEYENLYMLDSTAEERRSKKLNAPFKAKIYKKLSDCTVFVESSQKQAKQIFEETGKTVISVETDEIFQKEEDQK